MHILMNNSGKDFPLLINSPLSLGLIYSGWDDAWDPMGSPLIPDPFGSCWGMEGGCKPLFFLWFSE